MVNLGLSNVFRNKEIIKVVYGYTKKICQGSRQFKTWIFSSSDGEILSGSTQYYGIHHGLTKHKCDIDRGDNINT